MARAGRRSLDWPCLATSWVSSRCSTNCANRRTRSQPRGPKPWDWTLPPCMRRSKTVRGPPSPWLAAWRNRCDGSTPPRWSERRAKCRSSRRAASRSRRSSGKDPGRNPGDRSTGGAGRSRTSRRDLEGEHVQGLAELPVAGAPGLPGPASADPQARRARADQVHRADGQGAARRLMAGEKSAREQRQGRSQRYRLFGPAQRRRGSMER
jgi:hypothetical protein